MFRGVLLSLHGGKLDTLWRWSYTFIALLYPFYIESEIPIFPNTTTMALLLRVYWALAVSATIRVILTKISKRSGIAVQWNGGGGGLVICLGKCHYRYMEAN